MIEDVPLDHPDVEALLGGPGPDRLRERRCQLDHVDRMSPAAQGQGVAPRPSPDVEDLVAARIDGLVRKPPHPGVRCGAEQRWLAGAEPALVGSLDGQPLAPDLVAQGPVGECFVGEGDVGALRRGERFGKVLREQAPEPTELLLAAPPAHAVEGVGADRHVVLEQAGHGGQADAPARGRTPQQPPSHGVVKWIRLGSHSGHRRSRRRDVLPGRGS